MTSRVPLFNFVIPFLILYPIPNDIFWGNLGKLLLSIFIFGGVYYPKVKILNCRKWTTKLFMILLGISISFARSKQDFLTPINCQTELIASIDLTGFYQTKCGNVYKTAKINKIQESKIQWQGKDAIIENQYDFANEFRFLGKPLIVKGIIYQNELKLPTFAISKIIKNQNQSTLKKIGDSKDVLIENFWINSKASSHTKSFIIAFTTGTKRYIDNITKKLYISTGVMHLFAVSGLHFGIIYFLLKYIINFCSNSKFFTTFILISFLFFYLSFIGFAYSAQRAFLMILIWEISKLFSRRRCALSALSFSFFVTGLINPESLFSPGFQLSFTIVLLIIWFSKNNLVLPENKSFYAYSFGFLKCSLSAFGASFLILLGSFGQIVPVSIISNFIIIPFAIPIMIIFLTYLLNFYLLEIDLYFIVDFVFSTIQELLFLLNGLPFSFFSVDLEVNAYIYITQPILIIYFINKDWDFFKKLVFTFSVSFFCVFYVFYF